MRTNLALKAKGSITNRRSNINLRPVNKNFFGFCLYFFFCSFGVNDTGNVLLEAIFTPLPWGKNNHLGQRKAEMLDVAKVREVGRKGGFCLPLSSKGVREI